MKVLISTSTFGEYDRSPLDVLKGSGFEPVMNPYGRTLKRHELKALAKDAAGLIAGTERLDGPVLGAMRGLRIISRCGAGLDNIDLDAAKRLGVAVYNTPSGPTLAVAELAVALLLNLARRITEMDRDVRKGVWRKSAGSLLKGKKVGIIGFGRIGRKVAALLSPFGAEIRYFDPCRDESDSGCSPSDIDELLAWADAITIHASLASQCMRILGLRELSLMKEGAILVNTSRGGVVDEAALYEALSSGRLSGAALDVFEEEPYSGPLTALPNVILTPHIGSYAREARSEMEMEAVSNLLKGFGVASLATGAEKGAGRS
ncbi:MAG: phosphoglycerate dehydrogenase [Thermodesulfobacteriota bacterium]|nr:MAG: phosphoglycerate dehydrogenase [Thermodesulfobacteriota bacterium]